jgi:hypothetical protein
MAASQPQDFLDSAIEIYGGSSDLPPNNCGSFTFLTSPCKDILQSIRHSREFFVSVAGGAFP